MIRLSRQYLFALLLSCPGMIATKAHAVDTDSLRAVVTPVITTLMISHDIPGMAVALTIDGTPHVFNFGVAAPASGQAVTADTIFEIGSLSKPLTATLAAYAQARGALSLADHPGRHVPQLRGHPIDQATLLHLGTYTPGGLPLQFPESIADDEASLTYYREWAPTAAPGTVRQYSNPSLGLFGRAAANALGTGFTDAMQTIVFPAFGMSNTFIDVPAHAQAHYAWGERDGKAVRVSPGPFAAEAYGVKTTATDMLRFIQANIDPATLDKAMHDAVDTTQKGYFRIGPMVQGLGWEHYAYPLLPGQLQAGNSNRIALQAQAAETLPATDDDAPRLFNKTGSTGGFGAYALFVPQARIGIVMLANKNYPNAARIDAALAILKPLLPAR